MPLFPENYRASGLLLHITSLPSPYGIGDVGPGAVKWIDRLSEAGQSWRRHCRVAAIAPWNFGTSSTRSTIPRRHGAATYRIAVDNSAGTVAA
jgi:4-alpha-glucanotransferase